MLRAGAALGPVRNPSSLATTRGVPVTGLTSTTPCVPRLRASAACAFATPNGTRTAGAPSRTSKKGSPSRRAISRAIRIQVRFDGPVPAEAGVPSVNSAIVAIVVSSAAILTPAARRVAQRGCDPRGMVPPFSTEQRNALRYHGPPARRVGSPGDGHRADPVRTPPGELSAPAARVGL